MFPESLGEINVITMLHAGRISACTPSENGLRRVTGQQEGRLHEGHTSEGWHGHAPQGFRFVMLGGSVNGSDGSEVYPKRERQYSDYGARIFAQSKGVPRDVVEAVLQHP